MNKQGIAIVQFASVVQNFCSWGLQSFLVLYLVQHLHYKQDHAYIIFGAFTSLIFSISIIGGYLADKYTTNYHTIFLGGALFVVGYTMLATMSFLYLPLALVAIGVAYVNPNTKTLLGDLVGHDHPELKTKYFTYAYMFSNLGGLSGPLLFGLGKTLDIWLLGVYVGCLLSVLLLILWLIFKSHMLQKVLTSEKQQERYKAYFITVVLVMISSLLIQYEFASLLFLFIVIIFTAIYFLRLFNKSDSNGKDDLRVILLMLFSLLLYFTFTFQIYSSIIELINNYHLANILNQYAIPANVFTSIESLSVVVFSPVLVLFLAQLKKRHITISPVHKCCIGLLIGGFAFFLYALMVFEVPHYHHRTLLMFVALANMLLGIGELFIMPPTIAAISNARIMSSKGTLMGALNLFIAFSAYFSGWLSTTIKGTLESYQLAFLLIAIIAIVSAVLMFLLVKPHTNLS